MIGAQSVIGVAPDAAERGRKAALRVPGRGVGGGESGGGVGALSAK